MANNRLFLVHRPTGKSIAISKRYAAEWWGTSPMADDPLSKFFEECFEATEFEGRDDFDLQLEDNTEAPHIRKEGVTAPTACEHIWLIPSQPLPSANTICAKCGARNEERSTAHEGTCE